MFKWIYPEKHTLVIPNPFSNWAKNIFFLFWMLLLFGIVLLMRIVSPLLLFLPRLSFYFPSICSIFLCRHHSCGTKPKKPFLHKTFLVRTYSGWMVGSFFFSNPIFVYFFISSRGCQIWKNTLKVRNACEKPQPTDGMLNSYIFLFIRQLFSCFLLLFGLKGVNIC